MRLLQLLQLNSNVLITEILQTIKIVILKKIYSSIGVFTVTSVTEIKNIDEMYCFRCYGFIYLSVTDCNKERNIMKKEKSPYDQAVQYLSQVQYIDEMIGEKQDIIESMRSSITGTSASVEGERVQTSPKDRLGETCVKIVDLCTQMQDDIDKLLEMKTEVIQTIDQYVTDLKARKLLYLRYTKYMNIETAAHEMRLSRRTAYNLHKIAIISISAKFKGNLK